MNARPVLVLGASGGFGGGMASELFGRGRAVHILVRDADALRARMPVLAQTEIVVGDVQDTGMVVRAAKGCSAIVDGINYPFHRWVPRMETALANVIEAARRAEATILFPGNVYGLGRQTGAPLPESALNRPSTRKGSLRVQMEQALKRVASAHGPRVIVLRAGDYFGPSVRNGIVDRIFAHAVRGRPMRILGRPEVAHQWAYVPDLARVGADLLEMAEQLKPFEVVHFRGFAGWPLEDFLALVAREAGHPGLSYRTTPWPLLYLVGSLFPQVMELLEIRYLWKEGVVIDDPRRRQLLPDFQPTPIVDAVRATIQSYRRDGLRP